MICTFVCTVLAGSEHNMKFMYCQCEPLVVTMFHAWLWPATAHLWLAIAKLCHSFTFELLDRAEALLLECQVALKDVCKAVILFVHNSLESYSILDYVAFSDFKAFNLTPEKKFYPSLIDAFEEDRYEYFVLKIDIAIRICYWHRYMKVELQHFSFAFPDLDCGNVSRLSKGIIKVIRSHMYASIIIIHVVTL